MKPALKVLILEDSIADADMIQRLFEKEKIGCEFRLAMNENDFLNAFENFFPDVILCDNSLPQFNSSEALEITRQRLPHIPFILVTGTVSEEYAAGIIKQGADDYILKDRLARLPAAVFAALRHRRAEKEKVASELQKEFDSNNLRALINNTNDLMWSVDKKMKLITFNEAFNKVIKLSSGKQLAKGDKILSTQFTEEQLKRYEQFYQRALSGEIFTIIDRFDYPVEFWTEVSFYPIYSGEEVVGTACFSHDITERKKSEETLRVMEHEILNQKVEEQKKISRAIISAQENERNHIGQELHDNINQILAVIKMYLAKAGDNDIKLKELIKYPLGLLDDSINEIRSLSSKHVTPLQDIDLKELIQSLLDDISRHTTIKPIFVYNVINEAIEDELKLNIYRIIQEQINNILKHADSKNINVSIQASGKAIHIKVTDDGKGFNTDNKRKGIGISNMINRIKSFDGEVVLKSSPGNGCTVQIEIPY